MIRRLAFLLGFVPCCILDLGIWVWTGRKFVLADWLDKWADGEVV